MSDEKTPLQRELELKQNFFCNILHKITCGNDTPEEMERARIALERFQRDSSKLKGVIERLELNSIFQIFNYCTQPPTRKEFGQWMEACDEDFYAAYKNCEADDCLTDGPVEESINYLIQADEQFQLRRTITKAKDAFLKEGLGAAYNTLYMDSVKGAAGRTEELDLNEEAVMNKAVLDLSQRILDNESGVLNIKTGMQCFDKAKIYIHRGDVVGILGTNGGYKSSMARTWAYNIAQQGFKQLIYPLEMGCGYEHTLYVIQHALRQRPGSTLNRTDSNHGEMKLDGPAFADFEWASKDLIRMSREGLMCLPTFIDFEERATWPGIMRSIYKQADLAAQKGQKIDSVLIDYLTLISKEGAKNPREYMEDVIIDLARFARNTGIAVITPVQCNRGDVVKTSPCAKTCAWSTEDIYNYSEIEKSFSLIASVYTGPVLVEEEEPTKDGGTRMVRTLEDQEANHMYLATAKVRHGQPLDHASECIIHPSGGFIINTGGMFDDEGVIVGDTML